MQLTEEIKKRIREHTWGDTTKECCGLIIDNKTVIPCKNRASDSDTHFIINSLDIEKAKKRGNITAVYHSHIKSKDEDDGLSDEDKVISEYFNVCYVLHSLTTDEFYIYEPTRQPIGYIGRPYVRNVFDEFQLIRDYYQKELNINISTGIRNPEKFLINNGFSQVNSPEKHDILIMNWAGDKKNKRMVIYMGDKILAQPEFELSTKLDYNYGRKRWTEKVFRHNKLIT